MLGDDLAANTIGLDLTLLLKSVVVSLNQLGEAELSRDEDLLTAWEFELGTSESLSGEASLFWLSSHGEEHSTNVDTSRLAESLTEGTSHTLLESIGTGTRKHLVDSNDVPWVHSDSEMETFSTNVDDHVLVGSNTGGLKSFRSDLLLLVANQVSASWEEGMIGLLLTAIVHSDLRVWHTSVEARLWIGLVLLVPVAPRWSSSH